MLQILTLVLLIAPTLARADRASADFGAAGLTSDARTIYAAVASGFLAGDAQVDARAKIVELAQAGKIDRAAKRQNVMAAAVCWKQWK